MVALGENWKCPYCGHAQVLNEARVSQGWSRLHVEGSKVEGVPALHVEIIVCANADCREISLSVTLGAGHPGKREYFGPFKRWALLPASSAKPQPDYIPEPLRRDYNEACAIRDLSPKASATVTRRVLQGMIRDFCGISKKRLIDEIDELRDRIQKGKAPPGVLPDSVVAIDQVRGIGNVGAHMEADINVLIDVDPGEAQILIELVELLFDEWYVAQHDRTNRLGKLEKIAADKEKLKNLPPPTADVE
jgi:hypothetical protein